MSELGMIVCGLVFVGTLIWVFFDDCPYIANRSWARCPHFKIQVRLVWGCLGFVMLLLLLRK